MRKAGEEITDQLYNFEDKGGRRVALRPELTPSLARLALQRGKALVLPAKWFAIGQCWRYERSTRGRRREHYQWNMDIIGVPGGSVGRWVGGGGGPGDGRWGVVDRGGGSRGWGKGDVCYRLALHSPTSYPADAAATAAAAAGVEAEAELLSAIVAFFRRLGLGPGDVGLRVSSRKVLQAVLARYGVGGASFGPVCVVVDKMDKIPRAKVGGRWGGDGGRVGQATEWVAGGGDGWSICAQMVRMESNWDAVPAQCSTLGRGALHRCSSLQVVEELQKLGVAPDAIDGILAALQLRSVEALEGLLGAEDEAVSDLRRLWELAAAYGCADWLVFDASVVRGLAYYTGGVRRREGQGRVRLWVGGRVMGLSFARQGPRALAPSPAHFPLRLLPPPTLQRRRCGVRGL